MSRLAGHELFSEGRPYNADGSRPPNSYHAGTGGLGHGKCSCGALSPELNSGAKRKQWHRTHKAEIVNAARETHVPELPQPGPEVVHSHSVKDEDGYIEFMGDQAACERLFGQHVGPRTLSIDEQEAAAGENVYKVSVIAEYEIYQRAGSPEEAAEHASVGGMGVQGVDWAADMLGADVQHVEKLTESQWSGGVRVKCRKAVSTPKG